MAKYTLAQFQKKLKRWIRQTPNAIARALEKGAVEVEAYAQRYKLSGPTSYGGGFYSSRLDQVTGNLWRSLSHKVDMGAGRVTASVGTNLSNRGFPYPAYHEYEGKRPWLRPSVQKNQGRIAELILREHMATYKHAK